MRAGKLAGVVAAAVVVLGSTVAQGASWRDGAEVYEKVCGYCHEVNVGPVIKGRQLPVEYIERVVRYGNRAMPSFRQSEIDDAALADVARLINTSAPLAKE